MGQRHVATFHKAGSNWTRRLFRDVAEREGLNVWVDEPNAAEINQPIARGATETLCIFRNGRRPLFEEKRLAGEPVLLCVRDPKDALVSQYFSWRFSHQNNSDKLLKIRSDLSRMSQSEGLIYLIARGWVLMCRELEAWEEHLAEPEVGLLRFESLLTDFAPAMIAGLDHLQLATEPHYLAELEARYSFRKLSGRDPGDEKPEHHYRRGVAGDWRTHFTDSVAAAFDDQYGPLCDLLGYDRAGRLADDRAVGPAPVRPV